jgi:hypothetical protein
MSEENHNVGGFNRRAYDSCAYEQTLKQSRSPFDYQMTRFKYESKELCDQGVKYYPPFELVDNESELRNITRHSSKCTGKKYSPKCNWEKNGESCMNTFNGKPKSINVPALCPIVKTNMHAYSRKEVMQFDAPKNA